MASRLSRVGSDRSKDQGMSDRVRVAAANAKTGVPISDCPAAGLKAMAGSYAGYLERRTKGIMSSWQRTYVVLLDGCVYYFKSADAPKASGQSSLIGYTLDPNYKKGKYAFQLVPPKPTLGETLSFNAFDSSEHDEWVVAVEREVARAQIAALAAASGTPAQAAPSVALTNSGRVSSFMRQGSNPDLAFETSQSGDLRRQVSLKGAQRSVHADDDGDSGSSVSSSAPASRKASTSSQFASEEKPYIDLDCTQTVPASSSQQGPVRRTNSVTSSGGDEPSALPVINEPPPSRLTAKRVSVAAVSSLSRALLRRGSNSSIAELPEGGASPRPMRREEPPPVPQRPEDVASSPMDARGGHANDAADGERPAKGDYIYFEDEDLAGNSSGEDEENSKARPFARGESQTSLGRSQPSAHAPLASPRRMRADEFAPISPSPLRKDSAPAAAPTSTRLSQSSGSGLLSASVPGVRNGGGGGGGGGGGAYLEILDDGSPAGNVVTLASSPSPVPIVSPVPPKRQAEAKRTSIGDSFNPYENSPKPVRASVGESSRPNLRLSVDDSKSSGGRAGAASPVPVMRELDYDSVTKAFWYHGPITRELAEERILAGPVGHFLVRASLNGPDTVITVRGVDRPKHYKILWEDGLCHLGEGPRFQNAILLLRHFVSSPLPNAIGSLMLTKACHP
eukprot:Opistho-2@6056